MDISYQALQVKQYDPDRYICCLFANNSAQAKLFTILAFNAEIASIAEHTSELTSALIRITWWQDALNSLYQGNIHQHSLIKALNELVLTEKIPQNLFTELLTARMKELYQEPPLNMDSLIVFADKTGANLLEIMGYSLGIKNSANFRPLGIAWTLLGILRSAKYAKPLGKALLFPLDLLPEDFKLGDHNTKSIVKVIVKEMELHLSLVNPKLFSKATAPIDLLYFLAKYYLTLLIKNDYDILSEKLLINPVVKQLYLLQKYLWL